MSFEFPSGVDAEQLAISAKEGVHIGSGTQLLADDGASAAIATAAGTVHIEARSTVGTVLTPDHVFLGSGSTITGDLYATSTQIQDTGVTPEPQTPGSPSVVSWNVTFPQEVGPQVNLEPDRSDTLEPGAYESLRVASRSTVKLSTGTYYFDSIQLEPDSVLEIDNTGGTVVINVRGNFTHRGRIVSLGAASDLLLVSLSNQRVEIGDEFDGTLVAPYAEISVARPSSGAHDAQFFGRKVSLQGSVQLKATVAQATGPAIEALDATYEGSSDVPLPVPAPVFTSQTWEEWEAEQADFITALIDSNYSGELITLEPHPAGTEVQDASDYTLPEGTVLTTRDAPAIASRQDGAALPPLSQGYPLQVAVDEFKADIAGAESEIVAKPRFVYLAQGDTNGADDPDAVFGTPPAEEDVPPVCVFTADEEPPVPTVHNGQSIGDELPLGEQLAIRDVVDPLVFGNRPDYLVRQDPQDGSQYTYDKNRAPQFDGYWFFEAGAQAGWNGAGMEGRVYAGTYAGIVAIKQHQELLRVYVDAEGAILRQDPDTMELKPYFGSELDFRILGKTSLFGQRLPGWDTENDVASAKLKTTLLDATVSMFPDASAPRVQVGPFALILNGGAQVKIPLALDLDKLGPEVTLAPMFRVYVTIFAGLDIVIARLGVTGEADIIRVDMPFKAKVKWRDYRTPETCYSSADVDVTFQSIWSTLNGNLKVSVSAQVPIIGKVDIVDKKVVSWKGLEFDTGEVKLLPTWNIPLQRLPQGQCAFGAEACVIEAAPQWNIDDDSLPAARSVAVPYSNPDCLDQYVTEIDMRGRDLDSIFFSRKWDTASITSEEECQDAMVQVFIYRQLDNGEWEGMPWDQYKVTGQWLEDRDECQTIGAGLIDGEGNRNVTAGFPRSFVDTVGVDKVRFVTAGGAQCGQRTLSLGVLAGD